MTQVISLSWILLHHTREKWTQQNQWQHQIQICVVITDVASLLCSSGRFDAYDGICHSLHKVFKQHKIKKKKNYWKEKVSQNDDCWSRSPHTQRTHSISQPAIKKTPTLVVFGTSSLFFCFMCEQKQTKLNKLDSTTKLPYNLTKKMRCFKRFQYFFGFLSNLSANDTFLFYFFAIFSFFFFSNNTTLTHTFLLTLYICCYILLNI